MALMLASIAGCGHFTFLHPYLPLPKIEQQKAWLQNGDFRYWKITSRAFLESWGGPTYEHREHMEFFPLENGSLVPRFRVALGEYPAGWDHTVVSEDAVFFVYSDRGELLGFIDQRLVYRERMTVEQTHQLAKSWERESIFKTGLEKALQGR